MDGIIVIDAHGIVEAINASALRMFGYNESESLGQNVKLLMPEPDRSRHDGYIAHHLQTGERRIIGIGRAVTGRRKDGTTFPLHLSVGELDLDGEKHFTGILHDLSRRTELEDRLREATALARLGEMAAVIAHEVKNPLAAVRGAIQVLGTRLPPSTSDAVIVKEIIARLDGLNDLIQDLLVFARPPKPKFAALDITAMLASIASLLKTDPAFPALEISITGSVPPIAGDANLLDIAFQNLLINAAQAMQGRGTIDVKCHADHDWQSVEIIDQGPGIPAEIRAELFRPFKTTKARGTGLGMATAKRLVELHGGQISVVCPPAGGTEITVRLPTTVSEG
ncbi:MAG: PAS domain S-box protein [Cyanobacteria bacterium]|nr:PAS domain S-box protein [Cyanobacteriota bacterium]